MSTQRIGEHDERDILEVIRELENGRLNRTADPAEKDEKKPGPSAVSASDTSDLLDSLKKKRELLGLLDGYSEAKGIVERKQELEDAIQFLEQLNVALADE